MQSPQSFDTDGRTGEHGPQTHTEALNAATSSLPEAFILLHVQGAETGFITTPKV